MRVQTALLAIGLIAWNGDAVRAQYSHAPEPIGTVRQMYDGALTPDLAVDTFRNIDRLFPTRLVPRSATPIPLPPAAIPLTSFTITDRGHTYSLAQYLDTNRVAALLILKNGHIATEIYRYGNTRQTHWMSMSVAKSITSTLFGAAIKDGRVALTDTLSRVTPVVPFPAYQGVTLRDLLMMASGARWNERYTDSSSDRRHLLEAQISQRRGALMSVMYKLQRAAPPGTVNNYSTGETQVAAEALGFIVGGNLSDYLDMRIWSRIAESNASWWLDSPNGLEIGGSGFSATLRDYARFGQFLLNNGVVNGDSILPAGWLAEATTPKVLKGGTPLAYGYFWWTPTTEQSQRDSAYAARGIFGQHLYVNPKQKVVIVVWGAQTKPTGGEFVNEWAFFDSVVNALR
jgi:CubicO group peptidase (beta-lactamase class C family)